MGKTGTFLLFAASVTIAPLGSSVWDCLKSYKTKNPMISGVGRSVYSGLKIRVSIAQFLLVY